MLDNTSTTIHRHEVILRHRVVLICFTFVPVFSAQERSLRVTSFEARGGRAKCPYDPSSNYTVVYVGKLSFFSLHLHYQMKGLTVSGDWRLL